MPLGQNIPLRRFNILKKILNIILCAFLLVSLASCAKKKEVEVKKIEDAASVISESFDTCKLNFMPPSRDLLGFFYNGDYYIMDSNVFVDPNVLQAIPDLTLDKRIDINEVINKAGCVKLENGNFYGELIHEQSVYSISDDPEKLAICISGSCQVFSKFSPNHIYYESKNLKELLDNFGVIYLFDEDKYITVMDSYEKSQFVPQVVPVDSQVLVKSSLEPTKWYYYRYAYVEGENFIEISDDYRGEAYIVRFSNGLQD